MPGKNAFNNNVEQYEAWFTENPLAYVSELRAVRELLPPGSGLEIGVGTGRFAAPLGITNGIEPSRPMADLARKRGIKVGDGVAERLPYRDGEYDFCLLVTTVCFLDDMALAFREAFRVLRPGGALLIGFVDRESGLGREYLRRKDESLFYKEATFFSVDEIVLEMRTAGFTDFHFRQTLFRPLAEMEQPDQAREGTGEGAFVVVRGIKTEMPS